LNKVETSHKSSSSSSSNKSSSSSSSSSSGSSVASAVADGAIAAASSGDGDSSSSSSKSYTWLCAIPAPWSGFCFYGGRWLRADRSESAYSLAPAGERKEDDIKTSRNAPRYGEVQAGGFVGANTQLYGHDLAMRGWLGLIGADASWLRLYEPSSRNLDQLDLMRGSITGVFLAEKYVEMNVLAGVDVLHGHDWTPAFGPGVEVRTYPSSHFTVAGSFRASIFFEAGPPLLDSKLETGVAFGRLDFRVGARWLYQQDAASVWGPIASVVIRLGP
jgi:hypothetical protein